MLEWDILNYLKKWRTNLRATRFCLSVQCINNYYNYCYVDLFYFNLKSICP